jgi:hypothetical protein
MIVFYENNKYRTFWVCVCSLRYPACNAHAPYFRLWFVRVYHIFPHYFIKGTIFQRELLNIKCVFWFILQIFSETFLIVRRNERDTIKNVHRASCTVPVIFVRFKWKLNFSTDFGKILQCQISQKSVQWEPTCSMWTDRRTDMTRLIVAFRNIAETTKTINKYAIFYQTDIKELQFVQISAAMCH